MVYYNPYLPYNPYGQMLTTGSQTFGPQMQMPGYSQQAPAQQMSNTGNQLRNWVKGEAEANNFYVAPNCSVDLWDENDPVVYLKQADATGKPSLRVFDLVERIKPETSEEKGPDYATRDELAAFGQNLSSFTNVMKQMNDVVEGLRADIDTMKTDVYGLAGKKTGSRAKTDG